MKNKKRYGLIILFSSLFITFTSLVFFVIGCNNGTLVNKIGKSIALIFLILAIIALGYGIVLIIKYKFQRNFKKSIMILLPIFASLYAIGCTVFLVLLYGPSPSFRDWLITTAMATMNHKHYCKWFYSEEAINNVLSNNFIDDSGLETDPSLITIGNDDGNYKDEYDKEILDREEGTLYKIINFEVNGCKAYLGVVYDPSKISVGYTRKLGKEGQYIDVMAKEQNAVLAQNGGGFFDQNYNSNGSTPIGVTISNGKIITDYKSSRGVIGFNKNNVLVLRKNAQAQELINDGIRDAVTMGPFLIVNGKPSFIRGNGGWGYAARSAIGQRQDGIVLMLVVDSNEFRTKGASMVDLVEIMQRYGAINAANLDGGTSAVLVENGKIINDPIDSALKHKTRPIADMFKVVE